MPKTFNLLCYLFYFKYKNSLNSIVLESYTTLFIKAKVVLNNVNNN